MLEISQWLLAQQKDTKKRGALTNHFPPYHQQMIGVANLNPTTLQGGNQGASLKGRDSSQI